ncbi:MAG: hypothetical protein FWG99_08725 [Treponema sp.]|nr:hypothetical protein [Treponema sp.]
MKNKILLFLLFSILIPAFAEPLYSAQWGFSLDLPEGYYFAEGNNVDRFSFRGPDETLFDIRIYNGTFQTMKDMVDDVNRRLGNRGDTVFFEYSSKLASLTELIFGDTYGWALCVELEGAENSSVIPMLLALSYGQAGRDDLNLLHMSALDSIAPSEAERRYPGPIMIYGFPRGELQRTSLAAAGLGAMIRENDAEAAQVLIEREFAVLRRYLFLENWQEAWTRYYRAIYRDSWDRIADAMFQLERHWNVNIINSQGNIANNADAERMLAEKALAFVQGFEYERDFSGSDFTNLVTAVTEGRGDCDSRAMLWAMILAHADIRSAIMVSRNHNHAMGLADIAGTGARFEADGTRWLVAETTDRVDLGLIAQDVSDIESWLGIMFED